MEPAEPGPTITWNCEVHFIGEKVIDPVIHFCDICDHPILVYGRLIPCKHVFCNKCANERANKRCPRCNESVTRLEQCKLGQVYLCTHGTAKHDREGCRRTYLSERDLQAHVTHRHASKHQANVGHQSPSAASSQLRNQEASQLLAQPPPQNVQLNQFGIPNFTQRLPAPSIPTLIDEIHPPVPSSLRMRAPLLPLPPRTNLITIPIHGAELVPPAPSHFTRQQQ